MVKARKVIGCVVVSLVVLAPSIVSGIIYVQYANYYRALDAAKQWARLDDFPSSATDIRVEAAGSMFSPQFTVTFTAPLDEINACLDGSPGTAGVTPTTSGTIRKFDIDPGGGAAHAELEVDDAKQTVKVKTYWS